MKTDADSHAARCDYAVQPLDVDRLTCRKSAHEAKQRSGENRRQAVVRMKEGSFDVSHLTAEQRDGHF